MATVEAQFLPVCGGRNIPVTRSETPPKAVHPPRTVSPNTGRELDATGLYYYRARYYGTQMGRFISEDSIGFKGGIDLYTYALNNPVSLLDPFGNSPCLNIPDFVDAL